MAGADDGRAERVKRYKEERRRQFAAANGSAQSPVRLDRVQSERVSSSSRLDEDATSSLERKANVASSRVRTTRASRLRAAAALSAAETSPKTSPNHVSPKTLRDSLVEPTALRLSGLPMGGESRPIFPVSSAKTESSGATPRTSRLDLHVPTHRLNRLSLDLDTKLVGDLPHSANSAFKPPSNLQKQSREIGANRRSNRLSLDLDNKNLESAINGNVRISKDDLLLPVQMLHDLSLDVSDDKDDLTAPGTAEDNLFQPLQNEGRILSDIEIATNGIGEVKNVSDISVVPSQVDNVLRLCDNLSDSLKVSATGEDPQPRKPAAPASSPSDGTGAASGCQKGTCRRSSHPKPSPTKEKDTRQDEGVVRRGRLTSASFGLKTESSNSDHHQATRSHLAKTSPPRTAAPVLNRRASPRSYVSPRSSSQSPLSSPSAIKIQQKRRSAEINARTSSSTSPGPINNKALEAITKPTESSSRKSVKNKNEKVLPKPMLTRAAKLRQDRLEANEETRGDSEQNRIKKRLNTPNVSDNRLNGTTEDKDKKCDRRTPDNSVRSPVNNREQRQKAQSLDLDNRESCKMSSVDSRMMKSDKKSHANRRLTSRMDALAALTKETLAKVDRLAKRNNSEPPLSSVVVNEEKYQVPVSTHSKFASSNDRPLDDVSNSNNDHEDNVFHNLSNGGPSSSRGVIERLSDIDAVTQHLLEFEKHSSIGISSGDNQSDVREPARKHGEHSLLSYTPVSILKRKSSQEEHGSVSTPPVTFSPSVVDHEPSKARRHGQGILKKRRSLDESQVNRHRSCSPEVAFADDCDSDSRPILKCQRRSSLEELIRGRSPEGIQGILKRKFIRDSELFAEDNRSLGSPEPQGILKRKSNSSSSSSTASSHVSIAQAVILAAAGGAEVIEDKDGVRPILKKKSFSEERPCSEIYNIDTPKPILKKKSLTESDDNEYDRPKKTILKGARKISHDDGNASSSFDLSEDDRGSRRSSVLRHRSSDLSEGESTMRPILKQRGYAHSREHSQSPKPRLSFCSDDEHASQNYHENNAANRSSSDNDARYFTPPVQNLNMNLQSPEEDDSPARPSRFESGRLHSPSKLKDLFDNESPPTSPHFPSAVLRRRNLRPKAVGRSKSLASDFSEELDQILNSRRIHVEGEIQNDDSLLASSEDASPSVAGAVDEAAAPASFPSIAQRIQSMEQYFGISKPTSGAIPKHRQTRDKERFMTQPVTLSELQNISSLDFGQEAFQRRQPSPQTEESAFPIRNDFSELSAEEASKSPERYQSPSKIGNFVDNPYYLEPTPRREQNIAAYLSPVPLGITAPKNTPVPASRFTVRRGNWLPERRRTVGCFEDSDIEKSPERRRTSADFEVTSSTYNGNKGVDSSDFLHSPDRVREIEFARTRASDDSLHKGFRKLLNDSKDSPVTKEFNKIFEETTRRNSRLLEDSQLDKLIWDLYSQCDTEEPTEVSSARVSSSGDAPLSLADLSPRRAHLDLKLSPTKAERPKKLFESPEKEIGYQRGGREATLQELDRLEVELEDVRTALDVDSSALCGVDADHWSLNVSVDSGVFNRMSSGDSGPLSGEEPSLPQDFSKQPDVIPKSPISKPMTPSAVTPISPTEERKILGPSSPQLLKEMAEEARKASPVKNVQDDSDDSDSDDDLPVGEDANNPRALHGLMKSNSVSARASMWQQLQSQANKAAVRPVLRHSRTKPKDGSPSILDRFKTQPITLEEVTIATNENSLNPLNQSRSSFNLTLEQDEESQLDENDPAKLTLAEKMKLFGAKLPFKPPMGTIKKPRSPRFQTMPVLASEVDDARELNAKQHNLIVKDDMADIPSPRHKMIRLDIKPPSFDASKNRRSLIEDKSPSPSELNKQRKSSESTAEAKKSPVKNVAASKESPEQDPQSKQKKELAGANFRQAQNKLAEQASRMLTSEVKGILKSRTGAVPLLPSAVDAAVKKPDADQVQPSAKGKDAGSKPKEGAKTLTKGESSEGLKDEGIDSSSDEESSSTSTNSLDQSCSSSDSSEESEEEPSKSASPEPTLVKPSMLKSCRTESDLLRKRKEENDLKAGGKIKLPCMDEMRARQIMERCMMRSDSTAKVKTPVPAQRTVNILATREEKSVLATANLSAVVQLKNLKNGSLSPVKPVTNVLGNGKATVENEDIDDEVPDLVKKYVPQVFNTTSTVHTYNSKLMQELKLRKGSGASLARSAIMREEGSGSDGESSGGREVRQINNRRRGMRGALPPPQESGPPAVLPPGLQNSPWGLRRSATQPMAAAMPQRGVTIAERLAALQQSGNNDWRKRVCKLSPDDDVNTVITAKNKINETLTQQVEEQRRAAQLGPPDLPGDQIISDRRTKLETSAQGWRKRVGQNDATAFSVAGRMDRDGLAPLSPVTTPLTPAASQDKCTPQAARFKSRKGDGVTPAGPLKSASTAAVSQPASPLRSAAQFRRSISTSGMDDIQIPSDNTAMTKSEGGSAVNGSAPTGPSVMVPRADDETFTSFFQSASHTVVTSSSTTAYIPYNNNNNDIPLIPEDIDLDAIDSGTRHMLGGAAGNRVRAARRLGGSRNPLRALAARTDLRQEYTQPPLTGVADKETARINKDKLAQNSSMAVEALAGLAAREDFTTIHLKRASPPQGLAYSQSSGFGLDFVKPSLLIHVKGRRHVQARLAEPNHASINSGDCFVLVTPDQVFHYSGYYANVIERSRAAEIALHIHTTKDLGCANSTSIITLDEQHKNGSSKHWKQFWTLLDVDEDELDDFKPTPAGNADEDEIFESGIIPTNMCYEVVDDELVPVQEYWGQVPKIAMLDPSKILVFDFGSELYVWNGKNTILEVRRMAFQLAKELWDEGYDYKDCHLCPLSIPRLLGARTEIDELPKKGTARPEWAMITKVTQHMENILFKDKFLDWPDFSRVIKVKEEEDSLKGRAVEIKPCDAEEMWNKEYEDPSLVLELSHVGRGTHHYDKETMRHFEVKTKSVTKWIIQEYDYCKIDSADLNEFYSADSYIIRWEYQMTVTGRELNGKPSKHNLTGRDRCAYFCWQGKDASANEKGAAALLTVELDQEKGPQVRVAQGSEPPAFLNLFNGSLVIHQGKKGQDKSKHKLYMVRGNVSNESHLVQVPCSMRQLRSRASMMVVDKDNATLYVWHGAKSLKHTRLMAVDAARLVAEKEESDMFDKDVDEIELIEVQEGDEPKALIEMLGGANRQLYHSLATKGSEDIEVVDGVTPRLFHFTDLSGQFDAVEVLSPLRHETLVTPYPFSQQELYSASQPGLFLLDSGDSLWLWQGWWPQHGDNELIEAGPGAGTLRWQCCRRAAMETVLEYWKVSRPDARETVASVVVAGLEPLEFINLFDVWQDRDDVAEMNIAYGYKVGEGICSVSEELCRLSRTSFPLAVLRQRPLPDAVDPANIERYLTDQVFQETFGLTKEEFYQLPSWKQANIKKDLGLF